MEIREDMLEGERKLHYIELMEIIREGEQEKLKYYEGCRKEVERESVIREEWSVIWEELKTGKIRTSLTQRT